MKRNRDRMQFDSSNLICSSGENGRFDASQNENEDGSSLLNDGNNDVVIFLSGDDSILERKPCQEEIDLICSIINCISLHGQAFSHASAGIGEIFSR